MDRVNILVVSFISLRRLRMFSRGLTRNNTLAGCRIRGQCWSRDPYLVETSVPGVFACAAARFSPVKRVASAVGEGSIAIAFVHQYLASSSAAWRRGASG
jgi:thioredoxin reductase